STAGAGTVAMARKLQPNAITLDLGLSDIHGFVLLDLLKHAARPSHVPIHVISSVDHIASVMGRGAFGVTEKPADDDTLQRVFTDLKKHVAQQKSKKRRNSATAADIT